MANLKEGPTPTFEGRPTALGERLQTAIAGDLDDIDNTQCVGLGRDCNIPQAEREGDDNSNPYNCIYFMPQLGFNISNGDKSSLERMTSLFLRVCQTIIHSNYSIIYGLSKYSLYAQGKVLRILHRILPRRFKKNLSRIYILHPTAKFRACFKISKLFFEEKVAAKVTFVNSIAQLQSVLSPLAVKLPPSLIQLEDASQPHYPRPLPPMESLEALYDEHLGAPPFLAKCISYLREHAMQREGLFRVPGDQTLLTLCPRRFRDKECSSIVLADAFHDVSSVDDVKPRLSASSEEEKEDMSGSGSAVSEGKGASHPTATVVVSDVDVVAQLFKAYLRELSDPVITQQAYTELVSRMRDFKNESSASNEATDVNDEKVLGDAIERVLQECLSRPHWRTLQLILTFLADIAVESQVNKMSPDNIAVVFAPTLLHVDMSTPQSAMESLPLCQKIVRVLVLRKMEAHMATRMSPKISFKRFETS